MPEFKTVQEYGGFGRVFIPANKIAAIVEIPAQVVNDSSVLNKEVPRYVMSHTKVTVHFDCPDGWGRQQVVDSYDEALEKFRIGDSQEKGRANAKETE